MAVNLGKFLHTENGRIIMSILLGFGLASLFRSVCKGAGCMQFYAAPLDKIKDKIYKNGDKCVTFRPMYSKCSMDAKVLTFENKNDNS
jgi:hypothetical protein